MAKYDDTRPLAFFHIPKTAGTALVDGLLNATRPAIERHGWDRCLYGDYGDFASWDPGRLKYMFLDAAELANDGNFVTGHLGLSTIYDRYPNAQIVTIFREPISRILSHWVFWRGKNDDIDHDVGSFAQRVKLARLPLANFLADVRVASQIDNVCVRMLLWPDRRIPGDGFIDTSNDDLLVEDAWQRLESFDYVGIYEDANWPEQLSMWLDRPLELTLLNSTRQVPQQYRTTLDDEIGPRALALLQERSRLDWALWKRLVEMRLPDHNPQELQLKTRMKTVARMRELLK